MYMTMYTMTHAWLKARRDKDTLAITNSCLFCLEHPSRLVLMWKPKNWETSLTKPPLCFQGVLICAVPEWIFNAITIILFMHCTGNFCDVFFNRIVYDLLGFRAHVRQKWLRKLQAACALTLINFRGRRDLVGCVPLITLCNWLAASYPR